MPATRLEVGFIFSGCAARSRSIACILATACGKASFGTPNCKPWKEAK